VVRRAPQHRVMANELRDDEIVFRHRLHTAGERSRVARAVQRGDATTITPGAFVATVRWRELRPEQQHRALVRARAVLTPRVVFAAASAALVWQRPLLGLAPDRPHALARVGSQSRSTPLWHRHAATDDTHVEVDGVLVTPLAVALVDAARYLDFYAAVAMIDHALGPKHRAESWPATERVTRDALRAALASGSPSRRARAAFAIDVAVEASGSPGETLCRLLIAELGYCAPELQFELRDGDGRIGFVDFAWPDAMLVVEFDGLTKYSDPRFADGRTPAEVVVAEKRREDRIRALGYRVVRLTWADLHDRRRLRSLLDAAATPRTGARAPQWRR
jgi:hypothetical protein